MSTTIVLHKHFFLSWATPKGKVVFPEGPRAEPPSPQKRVEWLLLMPQSLGHLASLSSYCAPLPHCTFSAREWKRRGKGTREEKGDKGASQMVRTLYLSHLSIKKKKEKAVARIEAVYISWPITRTQSLQRRFRIECPWIVSQLIYGERSLSSTYLMRVKRS